MPDLSRHLTFPQQTYRSLARFCLHHPCDVRQQIQTMLCHYDGPRRVFVIVARRTDHPTRAGVWMPVLDVPEDLTEKAAATEAVELLRALLSCPLFAMSLVAEGWAP